MTKRILLFVFLSFFLFSCSKERDILSEDTGKSFVQKNIESPFYGNQNSNVQLIIFSDYQCPACIFFEKAIGEKLFNEYVLTNKIGMTYKNFPLSIHKNAPEDALAAMCAHEQGKFKDFSDKIYALEDEKKGLIVTKEERQGLAKSAGLDVEKFNQCVSDGRYVDRIKQDMALGEKMGLQGTPSVYANGQLINFDSEESFFGIIDQLLAK